MASGATSIDELPSMSFGNENTPLQELPNVNMKTRDSKPALESISYNPNEFSKQPPTSLQGNHFDNSSPQENMNNQQNTSFNNIPPEQIDKILHSIENSNANTKLPSRDIPMETNMIHQDKEAKPNYVPTERRNYIEQEVPEMNSSTYERKDVSYDTIYDDMQIPFIIAILYFIFQLPFMNKMLEQYIPFIFLTDGNLSLKGYFIKSLLFASLYYGIDKLINYLSLM